MSLKLKMTLWYSLLMLVIVGLVLGFMAYMADVAEEASAKKALTGAVKAYGENLRYEEGALSYWDGEKWQKNIPDFKDGIYLLVYNEDGGLISGDFLTVLPGPVPAYDSFGTINTDRGQVYYYDMFLDETFPDTSGEASGEPSEGASGEPSGEMVWGFSDEIYRSGVWLRGVMLAQNAGSVFQTAFVALPLLVVLAALGGWLMAKKALAPMGRIAASARDISGGEDLSRRVDIGAGKDELHMLAETINDMLERLEKSFLAERQFTSDASHELRTPTAVILAECDTAEKTAVTPEEFRQSLAVIRRQGQKMSALLGTLLSYTRREQGTERPELERIDLSELTEALCREQDRIRRREISLAADIEAAVMVRADASLIMSLIQNLITNAYKYGREKGHIWVSLKAEEGNAVLRVRDDGIGIPEGCRELIWNRFYQVDPARSNQDGSLGLGLSMARQIAQLHGGSLTVESVEGEGSEFTFTMPLDMKKD